MVTPADVTGIIDHFSQELSAQIGKYGPQTMHLVLAAKQAECIGNLITAGIRFLISLTVFIGCYRLTMNYARKLISTDKDSYTVGVVVYAAGALAGIIWGGSALTGLLETWNWVGAYAPAYALVHEILDKVAK